MEKVYIIILFFVPGMIVRLMNNFIAERTKAEAPKYEYLAELVVDSSVVSLITVSIFSVQTFGELIKQLNSVSYRSALRG